MYDVLYTFILSDFPIVCNRKCSAYIPGMDVHQVHYKMKRPQSNKALDQRRVFEAIQYFLMIQSY